MKNKEILEKSFKKHNCENIISPDGRVYVAILEAMQNVNKGLKVPAAFLEPIYPHDNLTTLVIRDCYGFIVDNGFLKDQLALSNSCEDFLNKVNYGITDEKTIVSEHNNTLIKKWYNDVALADRAIQFNKAKYKVISEIDFSKRGAITESMFRFIKEMNGVTYTELNMFYLNKNHETYDSHNDRGGSLTKHMASMRNYSKRIYSGEYKGITKRNGFWFTEKL